MASTIVSAPFSANEWKTYEWEFVTSEDSRYGYGNILTHIYITSRAFANEHDAQAKVIEILQNQPSFVHRCNNSTRVSIEELVKAVQDNKPDALFDGEIFSRMDHVTVIKSMEW